jgi:hypothetical protein
MNKLVVLLACALLTVSSQSLAASPSDYDGTYSGSIECDALPGQEPLRNEHFPVEFKNGQAQYERDVRKANTATPSGVTAKGKGTVSPDGDVSLTETAVGKGWDFEATYRGRFDGKTAQLSGAQHWHLQGTGAPWTRPCTIMLSPSQ